MSMSFRYLVLMYTKKLRSLRIVKPETFSLKAAMWSNLRKEAGQKKRKKERNQDTLETWGKDSTSQNPSFFLCQMEIPIPTL